MNVRGGWNCRRRAAVLQRAVTQPSGATPPRSSANAARRGIAAAPWLAERGAQTTRRGRSARRETRVAAASMLLRCQGPTAAVPTRGLDPCETRCGSPSSMARTAFALCAVVVLAAVAGQAWAADAAPKGEWRATFNVWTTPPSAEGADDGAQGACIPNVWSCWGTPIFAGSRGGAL